jgi:hypothetical protein
LCLQLFNIAHGEDAAIVAAGAAAAAAPAVSPYTQAWHMPPATTSLLEQHVYQAILAPTGVAPRTSRPLTTPGEMTAHHWLNFTKVYGKYLLSHVYAGHHLPALCIMLDFIKNCLASHITPELMDGIRDGALAVARNFDELFPPSEASLVLHLLIFHIPDTIRYWGPVRNYWAFPFERSATAQRCKTLCI